jgi:hypothetical protein
MRVTDPSKGCQFGYLETKLLNQNSIQEKIKGRLKPGIACCHLMQILLSSKVLVKNIKMIVYKTAILPVVLHGCEAWCLTLRKKQKLSVCREQGVEEDIWA